MNDPYHDMFILVGTKTLSTASQIVRIVHRAAVAPTPT